MEKGIVSAAMFLGSQAPEYANAVEIDERHKQIEEGLRNANITTKVYAHWAKLCDERRNELQEDLRRYIEYTEITASAGSN